MALPRFSFTNLLQTLGAVLVPSSEQASMPRANVLNAQLSSRWRTQPGWTIVAGQNDKIDFDRGGVKNATIAAGKYDTGAGMAAAIVTALEASDATPVWASNYNVTGTDKFTISSDLSFTLLFGSVNTNFELSVHIDLGYASSDTASAATHTAGSVAYQSRHTMSVDLGAATAFTTGIVSGHNLLTAGTVTLQADTATLVGVPIGLPNSNVDFTQVLAGTDMRSATFASQSKRYLRLLISDVQNREGYNEIGLWFVGTSSSLTVHPSVQYQKDNEHLSSVMFAEGGAHHQVARTRRRVYKLLWQFEEKNSLAVADRAVLDAIDALGIGTNFFATFDAPSESGLTVYGFNRVGLHEVYVQGTLWAVQMEMAEALG